MSAPEKDNSFNTNEPKIPAADAGNASNPSPANEVARCPEDQLLNDKAEKYLRESGNIEDLPDARDQQETDETLQQEKQPKNLVKPQ